MASVLGVNFYPEYFVYFLELSKLGNNAYLYLIRFTTEFL